MGPGQGGAQLPISTHGASALDGEVEQVQAGPSEDCDISSMDEIPVTISTSGTFLDADWESELVFQVRI